MTKTATIVGKSSVSAYAGVRHRGPAKIAIEQEGRRRPEEESLNENERCSVAEHKPDDFRAATPRKKRSRSAAIEPIPLVERKHLTIKEMVARYGGVYTEPALRHLVFQAEAYRRNPKSGLPSNGFLACIIRPPGMRKVLIDADKFEGWLTSRTENP